MTVVSIQGVPESVSTSGKSEIIRYTKQIELVGDYPNLFVFQKVFTAAIFKYGRQLYFIMAIPKWIVNNNF